MELYDKVRINNDKLEKYVGKTGKIVYRFNGPRSDIIWCLVKLDDDRGEHINIKESNLCLIEEEISESDEKYLALVYFHYLDTNPTTIPEAIALFSEDDLGKPEQTIYGTKDEILKRTKEEYKQYVGDLRIFILMNNEVYPVEVNQDIYLTIDW